MTRSGHCLTFSFLINKSSDDIQKFCANAAAAGSRTRQRQGCRWSNYCDDVTHYGLQGYRLKLKVHKCRLQVRQNFFNVLTYRTSYQSLFWSLLPLTCSRRDWTIGLRMWIVKALLVIHYITLGLVTSYMCNGAIRCVGSQMPTHKL